MKNGIVKSGKVTFSEYQNCIQHVFGLYTSCIQAEYKLYSAQIQFVYSPNTVCIRPEYKSTPPLHGRGVPCGLFAAVAGTF